MRNGMYQTARKILIAFALLAALTAQALGLELIPGGEAVGLEVETQGVLIASVSDRCAAKLKPGDRIFAVDQIPVHTCQQLQDRIAQADGTVALSMDRNGKRLDLLAPLQPDSGQLGITVRDSLAGVGTVTYIDPSTGAFGALGHGISDPQTGKLLPAAGGTVLPAQIVAVQKGERGKPGQLQGAATDLMPIGEIAKNTPCGVFGTLTQTAVPATLPVAPRGEIVTGTAKIRSTVCGTTPRDYDVTILKIYPDGAQDGRNLLLRVTDPALLTATGGIVQGMSGSPILQNGKLIGAVTHVLVDDPTTGYGIFLETMLEAAG